MVSIRGWIILHAFHLPVFSACVVVDLVMGLNTAFSTFLGRSVSRRRSWVNRFCWGCCACGVDYRCDCVADAVPSGGPATQWIDGFRGLRLPKLVQNARSSPIVHHGPFCTSFGHHSGPFSTIRRNSRTMPMPAKGVPPCRRHPQKYPVVPAYGKWSLYRSFKAKRAASRPVVTARPLDTPLMTLM